MAADWEMAPLDDLVDDILDRRGVTPLKLGSDFVASGHRVISAKAIKGRGVDLTADDPRFVDEGTYRKWMSTPLLADDVILTSEAPLGEPAYVSRNVEWCLGQRLFGIRTKKAKLHGRFLFYALQSEQVRHDLLSRATGTTAQGIRQTELRRVLIPLPMLDEQRAIAHILGTLDDKIELNRRMSETLEAMARALFKSWFVDFDPVRAKAEGREAGLPKETAALFPGSLEESELGEVPTGWPIGSLADLLTLGRDGVLPGDFSGEEFDHYSIPAYDDGRIPRRELGSAIRSGKLIVPSDAILLSKLNPRIPRVWIPEIDERCRSICSTEFLVARPRAGIPRSFLYCLLSSSGFSERFSTYVTGTSGSHQRVRPESLLTMPAVLPSRASMEQFDAVVASMLKRRTWTLKEGESLATLRDVLLPRLISGELRLENPERLVEEVVS